MSLSRECGVLSGRSLCDELIPRPEVSYRAWCVQDQVCSGVTITCTPTTSRYTEVRLRKKERKKE